MLKEEVDSLSAFVLDWSMIVIPAKAGIHRVRERIGVAPHETS
jgi:hypothetical protein